MGESDITIVVFGSLIGALLLGIPIGYALGIATVLGLLLTPIPLVYIAQTFYTGAGLFPLIAIPGFILAGNLMERYFLQRTPASLLPVLVRVPMLFGLVQSFLFSFRFKFKK